MKRIMFGLFAFLAFHSAFAFPTLKKVDSLMISIRAPFFTMWGIDFRPNAIFVDPSTNKMKIYTNEKGEYNEREQTWDNCVFPANSVTKYEGSNYLTINNMHYNAMSAIDRVSLFAHEGFHYYQDSIWQRASSSTNIHLDIAVGRTLLHVELDALNQALNGSKGALQEALSVRRYRMELFPENNEEVFGLHEGVAEYTGLRCSNSDILSKLLNMITYNSNVGYTNSFAYITTPVYLYFLDQSISNWTKLNPSEVFKNLERLYGVDSLSVSSSIEEVKRKYNYDSYFREEESLMPDLKLYKALLDGQSDRITILNNGINIMFNPNDRVFSLSNEAVLLNNVELKGVWGVLRVDKGVIRMNDWSKFILEPFESINGDIVTGNHYTISLDPSYELVKKGFEWVISKKE